MRAKLVNEYLNKFYQMKNKKDNWHYDWQDRS